MIVQNQINQQLKMNKSFRQSGQSPTIITWFQNHQYPFCKKTNSLSSLRNGIAIAQILTEKLPESYQPLFLPNIEIYNINPQRAILNLKVILNTLKSYYSQHPQLNVNIQDFNGQGLYFDHNMMQTFIFTVLMNLHSDSKEIPSDQALKNAYNGVQEISDIANLSSIMAHNESKPTEQETYACKYVSRKIQKVFSIDKKQAKMQKICNWLKECHHINVEEMNPETIIGQLVNSIFTGSRLDHQKVVKKSHYQLGASIVFKKVCDYLLSCERMPKQKVLQLRQEVDQGIIRQQLFWGVIQDMMNIKVSHSSKIRKNQSRSRQKTQQSKQVQAEKENITKSNLAHEQKKQITKRMPQVYICNEQFVRKAENWIKNELGYQYSLNKSKNTNKIQENPLLNGVLLGSIVMRIQLGKVNINKEPKRKLDVEKNMGQVMNCMIRRGLQSGRKFANFKPEYKTYLGILWEIRQEFQKKVMIEKVKRTEIAKQKKEQIRLISLDEKKKIIEWLNQLQIQVKNQWFIHPSIISEVCGDILELRLFRQTTKRIKQNNMIKILQELRRLGWQYEGNQVDALSQQGNQMRWSILKFIQELVKHKIYYYR